VIPKLNKNAHFATKDTTSRTVNALPNAVLVSTTSMSLLTKLTVDLAIDTVLYVMANLAALSVLKDSS
jgi:hypothetical protein